MSMKYQFIGILLMLLAGCTANDRNPAPSIQSDQSPLAGVAAPQDTAIRDAGHSGRASGSQPRSATAFSA